MSFFFLLLYLACTFFRPQDWVLAVYMWPLINVFSLATAFFLMIERMERGKLNFIKVPQNRMMVGFFIAILMSHVVHTYFAGLQLAFNQFLINFLLYFFILNAINSYRKYQIATWFIILLIVILVPQGVYQLKHGYGWAGQPPTIHKFLSHTEFGEQFFDADIRINWIGIFNDPNDLALIFVTAIGLLVAQVFSRSSFLTKIVSMPLIGVLIYGIYLTNSRGGLLALMATLFFYWVRRSRKFILGGIVGGIMAMGVLSFGPSRAALISTQESSANSRIQLWYEGIQLLKRNPIFGVGYDRFTEDLPQTAHNSFVLAAAELGMFGLFFWVGLIYASFKGLSIVQERSDKLRTPAVGLQAALIGFCAAAFFLSRTYVILPYLLFALSGSLMFIAKEEHPDIHYNFKRKDYWAIFWLCIAILSITYVIIKIGL